MDLTFTVTPEDDNSPLTVTVTFVRDDGEPDEEVIVVSFIC